MTPYEMSTLLLTTERLPESLHQQVEVSFISLFGCSRPVYYLFPYSAALLKDFVFITAVSVLVLYHDGNLGCVR